MNYLNSIITACIFFPFAAAVFTMPFVISQFRKYGGIPVIRVMIVYSFILYSICAFFLTVLPLPSFEAVEMMSPRPAGLVPGRDLYEALLDAGFSFADLSTFRDLSLYRRLFHSFGMFQILANILMQIPFGIYLRYYFKCSLKKTVLIGFLVSLFYELTQLSGLWFIYPKAYRYAEVDDLINNTLGAVTGYGITPLFELFLPDREQIDAMAYTKGLHVTLARRFFGWLADMAVLIPVNVLFYTHLSSASSRYAYAAAWIFINVFLLGILPALLQGSTVGQALVRLCVKKENGTQRASFLQLLWRNFLLYILGTFLVFLNSAFLGGAIYFLSAEKVSLNARMPAVIGLIGMPCLFLWFIGHTQRKYHTLPHSRYSRTCLVPVPVSIRIRKRKQENDENVFKNPE